MLLTLLLLTWMSVLVAIWRWLSQKYKFWTNLGIPHITPIIPPFGNVLMILKDWSYAETTIRIMVKFKNDPLVGFYHFTIPFLIVKDIDLIEHVIIKDFHNFTDRGMPGVDEKNKPFEVNLFTMTGKKWKVCRNKFSPMFTTSKVRKMFPQMKDLSKTLVKVIDKKPEGVDLIETFLQYALDVIASTTFGMDTRMLCEKQESKFRKMIKKAHVVSPKQFLSILLYYMFPSLAAKIRPKLMDNEVTNYLSNIVREALESRKSGLIKRDDFLQLMVTLQQKGSLDIELEDACDAYLNLQAEDKKTEHLELTDDLMIGQAFLFLLVGLDGTSSTLMYLCYELAMNPEVQEKAREEVMETVKATGILDYEAVNKMHYIDQCFKETLRLHTPVPFLFRYSLKEYTFPGTDITIPAGTKLVIPVIGLHMDDGIYPDPERFDPERFSPEMSRPPCSYLPFGDGPRMCLAMKFVITEMKCVVAKLLMQYKIVMNEATEVPIGAYKPYDSIKYNMPRRRKVLFDFQRLEGTTC